MPVEAFDMFPEVRSKPEEDPNSRYTPRALIWQLHQEFRFTIDVCSGPTAPSSEIIGCFWTIKDDALVKSWEGERVWCNPPFDDLETWIRKAWASRADLVVMLIPSDRTEQPFWQKHVEPFRDGRGTLFVEAGDWNLRLRTRFLAGRPSFGHPGNPEGVNVGSPQFPCVLLIWERA